MSIEIENISKSFSDLVLENVSIRIEDGQIVTILGENGCGKTTLFNIVAGILKPDNGSVSIKGKKPHEVFPSIIFQSYRESLFPWWTACQNIEFALKYKSQNSSTICDLNTLIEKLCINNFADRYPYELSGGEAQLIAIARALAFGSNVLLLDEPSSSLTLEMEQRFNEVFLEYCKKNKATVLFISHDPREAVYVSDKVFVLTKKPAKVKTCLDIKLTRPRNKNCPDYNNYVKNLIKYCKEV